MLGLDGIGLPADVVRHDDDDGRSLVRRLTIHTDANESKSVVVRIPPDPVDIFELGRSRGKLELEGENVAELSRNG